MKALTLYVSGKMQHSFNFIKSIFDYQLTFNKHINAIKIFPISINPTMY